MHRSFEFQRKTEGQRPELVGGPYNATVLKCLERRVSRTVQYIQTSIHLPTNDKNDPFLKFAKTYAGLASDGHTDAISLLNLPRPSLLCNSEAKKEEEQRR